MEEQIKEQIKKITEEAKDLFLKESERLFFERVKRDDVLKKQYKGREIFELLQNIDDAAIDYAQKSRIAYIELNDEWLTISNCGNPFTIETLQRLCQGTVSNKQGEYIGCKGIGFRSVLNWSDEIEIYSGESPNIISVKFSKKYAEDQYKKIKDKKHIQEQSEELRSTGIEPEFPIFKAPEYIDPIKKEYDTVIRIKIKNDEIRNKILEDIKNLDCYIMLFLPHIEKIVCKIIAGDNNEEFVYSKKDNSNNVTSILVNDEVKNKFFYGEKTIDGKIENSKKIKLAVALPTSKDDDTLSGCCIYNFFPIENLKSPFKALLHATFCLGDNRKDLDTSSEETKEINSIVYEELLKFYIEEVIKHYSGTKRLLSLKPLEYESYYNYKFPEGLEKLVDYESYKKYCASQPVFYNVNRNYLKADTDGIVLLKDCPRCFKGKEFSSVVQLDDKIIPFAKDILNCLEINHIDYKSYLYKAINKDSSSWLADERINTFKWWNKNEYESLPKLLRDHNNDFIESVDNPCFLSTPNNYSIPKWASISILNKDDEDLLLKKYKKEIEEIEKSNEQQEKTESNKRILPRLISKKVINIQEQSSRAVLISPINNSIDKDYERATNFVEWLWDLWKKERFDDSIKNITFHLPTINGNVRDAKNLFIGENDGNPIGAEIFNKLDQFEEVDTSTLSQKNSSPEEIKSFLCDLGVSQYPAAHVKEFDVKGCDNTLLQLIKDYIGSINIGYKYKPLKITVSCIDSIDEILNNNSTETILKWIISDSNLRDNLSRYEPSSSHFNYKPCIKYAREEKYDNYLPSFLRYVFSTVKWFAINEAKVAPKDLFISQHKFLNDIGINCIPEEKIGNISRDIKTDEENLKQILTSLGIKKSYLDLSSDKFYEILLKISNLKDSDLIENSKLFSREIYRTIIENEKSTYKKSEFYKLSNNQSEFFRSGKVLAKKKSGESTYINVENVFFSSSAVINLKDCYFIDVPTGSGQNIDFGKILNIKPFKNEYSIVNKEQSSCNDEFEKDFRDFLPCIMTYKTDKINEARNLSISLCSSVTIQFEGQRQSINEKYTLLKDSKGHWFIYVGDTEKYEELAKEKIATCLKQVFNVFFTTEKLLDKVVNLFMCSQQQREYFVETDFGSKENLKLTKKDITEPSEVISKIKEKLMNDFPSFTRFDLIDKIDWFNISDVHEQSKIYTLLKAIGKDPQYLSEISDRAISVENYNKSELKNLFEIKKKPYKLKVYHTLQNEETRREKLKSIWDCFENAINYDGLNTTNINLEEKIDEIEKKCLTYNKIGNDTSSIDYTSIYINNKDKLQNNPEFANGKFEKFINAFTNIYEKDSILYFEYKDEKYLENEFSEFIKNKEKEAKEDTSENTSIQNIIISEEIKEGKHNIKGSENIRKTVTVSETENNRNIEKLRKQGDDAEYLVIQTICKHKIRQIEEFLGNNYDINWKSGASKRVKKTEQDNCIYDITESDDSLGYDIELKNRIRTMFLEVKSSSKDDCSFILSKNEYTKAEKVESSKTEKYRIVFVSGTNEKKIQFIDHSLFCKEFFDIIPSEYSVAYIDKNSK